MLVRWLAWPLPGLKGGVCLRDKHGTGTGRASRCVQEPKPSLFSGWSHCHLGWLFACLFVQTLVPVAGSVPSCDPGTVEEAGPLHLPIMALYLLALA